MKIKKSKLQNLIKEQLQNINEGDNRYIELKYQLIDELNEYVDEEYANEFDTEVKLMVDYEMSEYIPGDRMQPEEPSEPINFEVNDFEIVEEETEADKVMNRAITKCIKEKGEGIVQMIFENSPEMFYD